MLSKKYQTTGPVASASAAGSIGVPGTSQISIYRRLSEGFGCQASSGTCGFCHQPAGRDMRLATCIHQYFDQYLPHIKGTSEQTINSYHQAFEMFLKFAAAHQKVAVKELQLEDLTSDLIFAFLNHLEDDRKNGARTRNSRVAAIKSFAKMIRLLYPEHRQR